MLSESKQARLAMIVMFTCLVAVTTTMIRIPIPATTGYFNIGDIFIVAAGLLLGPVAGLTVGAIGAGAADAIGYPQFILATMATKGLEGFLVGALSKGQKLSDSRAWLSAACGGATIVAGYFVFEAYIYPALGSSIPFFAVTNFQDAMVELVPNTVQAAIGVIGGVGLWKALSQLRTPRN